MSPHCSRTLSQSPPSSPPPPVQEIHQFENMNSQTQSDSVVVQQTQLAYDDESAYFNSFPTGFRFCPFDDELINGYLKRKIMNEQLPRNRIPEIELSKHDPEHLAGSTIPRTSRGPNDMKLDDWVLCRIYKKAEKSSRESHKRKRKDGDSSDDCEDSGLVHNPADNYNMPVINPSGGVDESNNHSLQFNLPQFPTETNDSVDNFSFQSNGSFGYDYPSSLAEPVSFKPPMDFIEDTNQLNSLPTFPTWPANDAYNPIFNEENYDMLIKFGFLNNNLFNTVNFIPANELLSNTIEMPPLPGYHPDATEMPPFPRY
ncbi:hypothetical protein NE237_001691 [Protea cynaroides]|uniref:NAC domain-containing protein n=1 Tax=Protea cynaroides TaxID=273540 RepID=A0A9Q0QYC5_9MAGN|nr:hypothetical protein NE237_001691 [Protea cynaroides]